MPLRPTFRPTLSEQRWRFNEPQLLKLDLSRLTVRHSKFGKSRELLVHPSTVAALRYYLRRRDRPRSATNTPAVLVSTAGTRLLYCNVQWTFHRLVRSEERRVGKECSCRVAKWR